MFIDKALAYGYVKLGFLGYFSPVFLIDINGVSWYQVAL